MSHIVVEEDPNADVREELEQLTRQLEAMRCTHEFFRERLAQEQQRVASAAAALGPPSLATYTSGSSSERQEDSISAGKRTRYRDFANDETDGPLYRSPVGFGAAHTGAAQQVVESSGSSPGPIVVVAPGDDDDAPAEHEYYDENDLGDVTYRSLSGVGCLAVEPDADDLAAAMAAGAGVGKGGAPPLASLRRLSAALAALVAQGAAAPKSEVAARLDDLAALLDGC